MIEVARVSQMELICAILAELDRQIPGVCLNEITMNTIIRAADLVVAAMNNAYRQEVSNETLGIYP